MRWILLTTTAIVLLILAFTFFYFNEKIFFSPTSIPNFEIEGSLAPAGASLTGENKVTFANGIYTLTYSENGNVLTQYEIDTNSPDIKKGMFSVKGIVTEQLGRQEFYPVLRSGTGYRPIDKNANILWPTQLGGQITLTHNIYPNKLVELKYIEHISFDQVTIEKRYLVEIVGKTLVLRVEALNPPASPYGYYEGFVFDSNVIDNPKDISISYAEFAPVVIGGALNNRYYLTTYFDYSLSNSNYWPWFQSITNPTNKIYLRVNVPAYKVGQNEMYNPLSEVFYITASSDINEVLPKINRQPAQYRDEFNNRVVLELSSLPGPPVLSGLEDKLFDRAGKYVIDVLKLYGFDDLIFLNQVWGSLAPEGPCWSINPKHYPASQNFGGSSKLTLLSQKAKNHGYLFGLYQIYTDMYKNPSGAGIWEPENLVVEPDGNWRNYGFAVTGCPTITSPTNVELPQPLVIKPDKWLSYAQLDTPKIKNDYNPTTGYLDVHAKLPAPLLIDFDPNPSNTARTFKDIYQHVDSILDYQRSQIQGPIIGEGGSFESYPSDTINAGFIEALKGKLQLQDLELMGYLLLKLLLFLILSLSVLNL